MLRNALTSAAVLAALTFSSAAVAQVCTKDMDCSGEAICEDGQCVGEGGEPVSPGATAAAPGAAAAPVAGLVNVEFIPRGNPVLVTDVATSKSCTAPCTLQLPPGSREIRIATKNYRWPITVGPAGGKFTVAPRSSGLIALGIVGLAVGGGIALVGYAFSQIDDSDPDFPDETDGDEEINELGTNMLITGSLLAVLGFISLVSAERGRPMEAVGPRRRWVAQRPVLLPYAAPRKGGGTVGFAFTF